jgi:enoyl-CoA hydratase
MSAEETGEPELVTEKRDRALVVRINRPAARNALNMATMAAIGTALAGADADPGIGSVVITGTGDRAFSAGLDLREFSGGTFTPTPETQPGLSVWGQFLRGTGGCAKPVIAAVQATALAGGFELLLACDLAVVADDAKLGLPEVKRGLFAAGGGMYLARRIPLAKALELTLTGEPVTPQQALGLGLVNAVVPAAQVLDRALEYAALISNNGPLAVQATKRLVRTAGFETVSAVRDLHDELYKSVFFSADAKEGATAFVERRPAVWSGR